MPQFDYRLTEKVYESRVEWEDGAGSLQNIVTDKSEPQVIFAWREKDENFGRNLMKSHSLNLPEDSSDGRTEYTHTLERRLSGTEDAWKFLGFLYPHDEDDEEESFL